MIRFPLIRTAVPVVVMATLLATSALGPARAEPAQASAAQTAAATRHAPTGIEDRITRLQQQLQITPAQMPQWNAVAQVMRENAQAVHNIAVERTRNHGTMTALDDLRSYEALTEAHAAGIGKLLPIFETLYASMSDQQKKHADVLFARFDRPSRAGRAS